MKKDIFKGKFKSYSLLAGAIVGVKLSASAQILYTDVNPDDTCIFYIGEDHYYLGLDLDNNGTFDFYASQNFNFYTGTGEIILNASYTTLNSVAGVGSISHGATFGSALKFPFKLPFNSPIDSNLEWVKPRPFFPVTWFHLDSQAILNAKGFYQYGYFGYWANLPEGDGYLGLRLNLNGNQYYGWVRMQVDSQAHYMIVKDYALNLTPEAAILAGEGIPSAVENQKSDSHLKIYPVPTSSDLFIKGLYQNDGEFDATIYDAVGRRLIVQTISSSQNEIDVSNFPDGIYFLEVKNEDQVLVKKFEVKH